MIRPPWLKAGDRAGIVAPSGAVKPEEVLQSIDVLKGWGLVPVEGKYLFRSRNSFAGTDAQRADDFNAMLRDDSIRAIICARGGYGAARIIDRIDFGAFRRNPKWIAGCSDITVFHAALQQVAGSESLHTAMLRHDDVASLDSLRAALFGELKQYTLPPHPLNRAGRATGLLTGGNLSVLFSLSGTRYEPGWRDKIVFIEDVGEYLYHIDRMLTQYRLRGWLEGIGGLIVGGMNAMKVSPSGYRTPAYRIVQRETANHSFPVVFGFPAGHEHPNLALIMGSTVTLESGTSVCHLLF